MKMARIRKQQNNKELGALIKNVSHKLRQFREEEELSQNELARRALIGQSTINEIENRVSADLQLSTLCMLSRALKRPVTDFLADSDLEIKDQDKSELIRAVYELGKSHKKINRITQRFR